MSEKVFRLRNLVSVFLTAQDLGQGTMCAFSHQPTNFFTDGTMTVYSTLRCNQQHRDILAKTQVSQNLFPAIEFYPRAESTSEAATPDSEKSKGETARKFPVPLDPSAPNGKTCDHCINVFDRGTPE